MSASRADERLSPIDNVTATIAAGLAGRMRLLAQSLDRLDRLESGSGAWLSRFDVDELPFAAEDLTLRGLRTAADPTNFSILKTIALVDSQSIDAVMSATGLGRLVLSERLNDLVQVGFVARLIDTDHAQITGAGAGVVQLVEALAAEVSAQFRAQSR